MKNQLARNKVLIPDIPDTLAGEMNRLSHLMIDAMKNNYSDEVFKENCDAIDQALKSLSRNTNDIRLMEITGTLNK